MTYAHPDFLFSTMRCAFTAFFCRYAKSMSLTQIASIAKVLLALTRLLLQAPSENLWILASGTTRRLLRQSCPCLLACDSNDIAVVCEKTRLVRRKPRLVRCILHCGECTLPSHFAMFKTCLCTVCLCFHEANLTCLAARCIPTRTRRREFSVSKKCCVGSPQTPCFSHCLNEGHLP